ncbi:uncharacterized protein LOC107794385 [Nicotiana tabacum]|uniref:Uncharacterized protein LOC107794385 n=2 Tax=Nicotiana TaxID=4085 RepID=A0A1S4A6T0_TOBAC|nr:PREDICTED: uncharacterized protein LOC104228893 [Nicotiana sylvestris]XP_016472353.1 PREDICTED: uncharacterized protein LOC107794385 [Nicotiana tabacum]
MRIQLGSRRRRLSLHRALVATAIFTAIGLLILTLRSVDPSTQLPITTSDSENRDAKPAHTTNLRSDAAQSLKTCATVEEMGEVFSRGFSEESYRVRNIIQNHFAINGASRVRALPPEEFCRHGFVLGKASEAGFGNEMYKILTAAALSVMLNRSLIIGQTRGRYPFEDFISYSNISFTLKEIKHLWRQNGCLTKYGRHLIIRIDDFQKPARTNVLCSNWRVWEQPIIWFQNTTDAVAAQFFLKNVHDEMRIAASNLFGKPADLHHRPNVFGELMRLLISPSENIQHAVNWALSGGADPDIALHMRMLMNRSIRAVQAAFSCIRKSVENLKLTSKPRVVLVSDNPSLVKDIAPDLNQFAEVLHFDFESFKGNISGNSHVHTLNFRTKDWGTAPRWVAFVDFFLASRAKHAVVSGAHRRVGTTFAQLVAALAAANSLDDRSSAGSNFTFLSSFQSNLLAEGLKNQIGWGHVWNRFAGTLSCHNQSKQCAHTPILPPAWWDGLWQSPIPRDVHRMEAYGIRLSGFGTFDDNQLHSFCSSRKQSVLTVPLI